MAGRGWHREVIVCIETNVSMVCRIGVCFFLQLRLTMCMACSASPVSGVFKAVLHVWPHPLSPCAAPHKHSSRKHISPVCVVLSKHMSVHAQLHGDVKHSTRRCHWQVVAELLPASCRTCISGPDALSYAHSGF